MDSPSRPTNTEYFQPTYMKNDEIERKNIKQNTQ